MGKSDWKSVRYNRPNGAKFVYYVQRNCYVQKAISFLEFISKISIQIETEWMVEKRHQNFQINDDEKKYLA